MKVEYDEWNAILPAAAHFTNLPVFQVSETTAVRSYTPVSDLPADSHTFDVLAGSSHVVHRESQFITSALDCTFKDATWKMELHGQKRAAA